MVDWFKRRVGTFAAIALGATVAGCADMYGLGEASGVPLADFDMSGTPPSTLELAGPDRVIVSTGDGLAITVEGDANAADALRFDRRGDTLTIARDQKIFDGRGKAIVRVSMPPASGLSIAGSGEMEADTVATDAEIEIAGSGNISVEMIEAERLEIEIAGSGGVTSSGTARNLSIEIAGSGDVNLADLTADTVTVEIAGSGDVELASNGTVDAEIAGSGNITVTGDASCSAETAGSGSLRCRPAETASASANETSGGEAEADASAAP